MPSLKNDRRKNKRWLARAKRGTTEYFLGYYPTYNEALVVELDFATRIPPKKKRTEKNG